MISTRGRYALRVLIDLAEHRNGSYIPMKDVADRQDISLKYEYASLCGITEEELKATFRPEITAMAKEQGLSAEGCIEKLRQTYDGYHFHPKGEGVYNPFSLLNALDDREYNSYWFATGTPTFLVQWLYEKRFSAQRLTDKTLYADEASLSDYRVDNPNPVPLLYQTGYLTIVDYDAPRKRYTLGLPNQEVEYGFLNNLLPLYAPAFASGTGKDVFSLEECLDVGNLDSVRDILAALFASIPYTDVSKAPFEHYFQSVIFILFTLLGQLVKCEVHSAKGRADCIVEVKAYVYIFEFKLDKSAEAALAQIEEKQYALPYAADSRQLYKIGVSFDSATRSLSEWKVVRA